MSMTSFEPETLRVAGFVDIAIGAGFADVNAPKLSELDMLVTCSIEGLESVTNVATRELNVLCKRDAQEVVDTITRALGTLTFRVDGIAGEEDLKVLVKEGLTGCLFLRPYETSVAEGGAMPAVGDKGDAFNFRYSRVDRGAAAPGNDWTIVADVLEVTRSELGVALVA